MATKFFDLNKIKAPTGDEQEFDSKRITGKNFWTQITVIENKQGGDGGATNTGAVGLGNRLGAALNAGVTGGNTPPLVSGARPLSEITGPQSQAGDNARGGANRALSVATLIASSVALPLPQELVQSYNQDWSVDETSLSEQAAASMIGGRGNSIDFAMPGTGQVGDSLKNQVVRLGAQSSFRKELKERGLAYNPYKEIFYNGVQFRQFNYTWEFAATSERESKVIEELIHNFTFHSSPEYVGGETMSPYKIPDSFEVEFVGTKIPKMKALVLSEFTPNYSNSGVGPKFQYDGYASFIGLSATFTEVIPLTRKEINELRVK